MRLLMRVICASDVLVGVKPRNLYKTIGPIVQFSPNSDFVGKYFSLWSPNAIVLDFQSLIVLILSLADFSEIYTSWVHLSATLLYGNNIELKTNLDIWA